MIAVVEDFLRQTERIVSIVLYASVVEEWKERAMLRNRHQFREFDNPRHRFDQGKSWMLFRDFEVPLEWKGMPPRKINLGVRSLDRPGAHPVDAVVEARNVLQIEEVSAKSSTRNVCPGRGSGFPVLEDAGVLWRG
jgi:hypothetical protein